MSALENTRVLELADGVAGEYCGKLLADFGADVIKVEAPGRGSATRGLGPFAQDGPAGETSALFAYLNTNKRSVAFDVTSADGRKAVANLLAHVDVVIDDHADGWLASVGLDPATIETLHPRLVVCSITAYGASPPEERRLACDLNVFHASGWGFHTPSGAPPDQVPLKGAGRFLVSYEAGLDAALCVAASLVDRQASGLGRVIDVSKQAVMASRADYVLAQMVAGDMNVGSHRTAYDLHGPAGIFECRDGYAYLWMSAPAHWEALGKLMGQPDWMKDFAPNWLERDCTLERVALCRRHVAAWLKGQEKERISTEAQALGLTMVAANDASDLKTSPQYAFREYFQRVTHPVLGTLEYPTVPYRLSATPTALRTPAPALGEHTREVLAP